jgi:hypothetical protein
MATSPQIATAPRVTSTRVAQRTFVALAVTGALAGGIFAASSSDTDHAGPVTAGRTAVSHRPDISARHRVATRGRAVVRVVK